MTVRSRLRVNALCDLNLGLRDCPGGVLLVVAGGAARRSSRVRRAPPAPGWHRWVCSRSCSM